MGNPTYACSAALLRHWWKPVERAGFSVRTLSQERLSFPTSTQVMSVWEVRRDRVCIKVNANEIIRTSGEVLWNDQIVYFWYHNRSAAAEVERILLASGARSMGRPFFCKRLYLCPRVLLDRLWDYLGQHTMQIEVHKPTGEDSERERNDPSYAHATVWMERMPLSITTGPAIDPDTEEEKHYLAVDYRCGFLRSESSYRRVLEELEALLQARGAERLAVIADRQAYGHDSKSAP